MFFFFQAEDGIRDLVRSRGLGDVYKRQAFFSSDFTEVRPSRVPMPGALVVKKGWNTWDCSSSGMPVPVSSISRRGPTRPSSDPGARPLSCLLYTSDAADERSSVDLGGRRIIKKKTKRKNTESAIVIAGKKRIVHSDSKHTRQLHSRDNNHETYGKK